MSQVTLSFPPSDIGTNGLWQLLPANALEPRASRRKWSHPKGGASVEHSCKQSKGLASHCLLSSENQPVSQQGEKQKRVPEPVWRGKPGHHLATAEPKAAGHRMMTEPQAVTHSSLEADKRAYFPKITIRKANWSPGQALGQTFKPTISLTFGNECKSH